MAELPIQHRKQGKKWWLWLLLILLLILVIWYFMRDGGTATGAFRTPTGLAPATLVAAGAGGVTAPARLAS